MGYADRVKDTTTTTGTGNVTLSGTPPTGYRTFGSVFATNDPIDYVIALGAEWEVGTGYLSASTTLVRVVLLRIDSRAGDARGCQGSGPARHGGD